MSRVFRFDPRANQGGRSICNTANEIPRLEGLHIVPHYLPGKNPEADFMIAHASLPKEAALGVRQVLYPEYRQAEDALQGARVMRPVLRMDRTRG